LTDAIADGAAMTDQNLPVKLNGREKLAVTIQAGLQCIPCVGSAIATLYFGTKQEKRFKRIESFLQEVAEELRQAQVPPAECYDEEALVAIIEELLERVEREHTTEKRQHMKEYFKNVLRDPVTSENYDERKFFLQALDSMSLLECKVLAWVHGQASPVAVGEIIRAGVQLYAIVGAVQRLRSYGFLQAAQDRLALGTSDNMLSMKVSVSVFGRNFCDFCAVRSTS